MKKNGNETGTFSSATFLAVRLLLIGSLMLGVMTCHAENRAAIDPNKEKVLVTIGGVDFDIPLGYFYEKTIWTKGEWPKPKKERTVNRDMVIVAHLNGLRPWSRELDADFKSGVPTTRIHIHGDYPTRWLENYMKPRTSSLSVKSDGIPLPGLVGVESAYAAREVNYLKSIRPEKPYFRIRCHTSPMTIKCEVMFDFENMAVVSYAIPIARLGDWKQIHNEVMTLMTTLKTKQGDL